MAFPFETVDDSNQKFAGNVIMSVDGPCYVEQILGLNKDQKAIIYMLPYDAGQKVEKPFTDQFFSFRKLPRLGYVNYEPEALFLERKPVRKIHQGLITENVHIPNFIKPRLNVRYPNWGILIRTKELVKMFENKYPLYDKCFAENDNITAFNKAFAVGFDDELDQYILYYKGSRTGMINEDKEIILAKRWGYLKETLQEMDIKVKVKGA